ncbi:MAG: hypothetical protein GX605_03080 [Chloroflexi bacterium]|nr:hypothetical protein [Chloroflexota bacterium]
MPQQRLPGGTYALRRAAPLLAFLLYALLAVALTYPLVGHLGTHVPGDGGDDPALAWNLWWVPYALVHLGRSPFACDFMFYPLGINLAFYTLTVWNAFLSYPWQAVANLVVASNVQLLASFALSAWGGYLLCRYLLGGLGRAGRRDAELAAWLAGLVYGFASAKLFFAALGQFNIASSHWTPFYVLYLVRALRTPRRWREWSLAALFFALQGWSEFTYASFLALFTLAFVVGWAALRLWQRQWKRLRAMLPGLALLAGLALLGLSPVVAAMLPDMLAEGDFLVEGSGFAETFSADLLSLWVPTSLHPWLGHVAEGLAFPGDKGQHLYLGYAALALAIWGLVQRPRRLHVFFALALLVFGVLALGPRAHVNGAEWGPALPFALLQRLPFFNGNRYPGRYGVLVLLCLAVLAGYGARALLGRLPGRRQAALAVLLAALMAGEYLSVPLPLSDMRLPPAYRALRPFPGEEWAVLDLPLAWRNGFRIFGVLDPVFMYAQFHQTTHGGRLLSGNTSRNPEYKFQYFVEAPILSSILALQNGHPLPPGTQEADAGQAAEVLGALGVRYVVLHKAQAPPALADYVANVLPVHLLYEDDGETVYAVAVEEAGGPVAVEFQRPAERLYLGEGWSGLTAFDGASVAWAQRRETRLLVPWSGRAQTLRMRLYAPAAGQMVRLVWEGQPLGERALAPGWSEVAWSVPAGQPGRQVAEARLRWGQRWEPSVLAAGQPIGQTGALSPVQLHVRSAGLEVGWFAHIWVDGREVAPGGRGYNLAALEPASGAVWAASSFDTFADEGESQALAEFIAGVPQGYIVAAAVNDEASLHLTEEAVQALGTVGGQTDLRGRFRWSHAVIGVKGAAPGQALEAAGLTAPASPAVGQPLSDPCLAAALDWLRLEG